jgi:NitT/TauT family transport system permease protein
MRDLDPDTTKKRHPAFDRASPWIFGLLLVLIWQIAVPLANVSELTLPTPWRIVSRIWIDYRILARDASVTFLEVLLGFAVAIVIAIPLALAIFYSSLMERTFYPLLIALQTVPKVALAPLLVLWLGFGFAPKIVIGSLTAFFPIVIGTVVGLEMLEDEMVRLMKSMGASEWQTFIKLRLPAALPNIFGGLKIGIGLAVIGSIIGEYVASENGLGYRQLTANAQFDSTMNFAALVVISVMGVVMFYGIHAVERAVTRLS